MFLFFKINTVSPAYLVDIFDFFEHSKSENARERKKYYLFVDLINAFIEKLSNWRPKLQEGNFSMFSSLAGISNLDDELKTNVAQHLEKLERKFKTYFPEISRMTCHLHEIRFSFSLRK